MRIFSVASGFPAQNIAGLYRKLVAHNGNANSNVWPIQRQNKKSLQLLRYTAMTALLVPGAITVKAVRPEIGIGNGMTKALLLSAPSEQLQWIYYGNLAV